MREIFKEDKYFILVLCVLGTLASTYPHLANLIVHGNISWIADADELGLYLPVINFALENNLWTLLDPSSLDNTPMGYYPWLQFIPFKLLVQILGGNSDLFGFLWRLWGGVTISISVYLLVKITFGNKWLAVLGVLFFSFDPGYHSSFPILENLKILFGDMNQQLVGKPHFLTQWRLITPGVSLVYLLFFFICLQLALKNKENKKYLYLAVFSNALLFYTYFYYWTGIGLALWIAIALDKENRLLYFKVGFFGLLGGLPDILRKMSLKTSGSEDWLIRTDNFLPIERFSEFLIHYKVIFILALSFYFIWNYKRDLLFLWSTALSSILLANHQVVTGLQIQNFHYSYLRAPAALMLLIFLFEFLLNKIPALKNKSILVIGLYALFIVPSGFYLRNLETFHATEPKLINEMSRDYAEWNPLNDEERKIITGERFLVFFASYKNQMVPLSNYLVEFNKKVSMDEWHERDAFKYFLLGHNRNEYIQRLEKLQKTIVWGPWSRGGDQKEKLKTERLAHYDKIVSSPDSYLSKYSPKILLVDTDKMPNPIGNWELESKFKKYKKWKFKEAN